MNCVLNLKLNLNVLSAIRKIGLKFDLLRGKNKQIGFLLKEENHAAGVEEQFLIILFIKRFKIT